MHKLPVSPMAKYFVCVQPELEARCGDISSSEFKQLAQRNGKGNSTIFGGDSGVSMRSLFPTTIIELLSARARRVS